MLPTAPLGFPRGLDDLPSLRAAAARVILASLMS